MSEYFCYISAFKAYVNLGFYYGAVLPDPEGLMEGTGKNLRHIKITSVVAADQPAVRDLLEAALEERRESLLV